MNPIHTVLCPVDFTTVTERAIDIGVQLCQRTGARLVLHHNLGPAPPDFLGVHWMWDEEHGEDDGRREGTVNEEFSKLFADLPEDLEYEAKITRGPLDQGLLFLAETLPADLVVLGSHGASNAEHSSLTEQIILKAPCSVLATAEQLRPGALTVAAHDAGEPLPVLAATDLSGHDSGAVSFAFALAETMPYELHLLHALKAGHGTTEGAHRAAESEAVEKLTELVPDHLRKRTHLHVKWGPPAQAILEAAADLDAVFILLGARKHGLLYRALRGLTSLEVLRGSRWPVWFVPTDRPQRRQHDEESSHRTRDHFPAVQPVRQGETMDWKEARNQTIAQWEGIRAGLGELLPVDLVTEVNAVSELCHKSLEVSVDPATRCDFCIAYGDVGGCGRVRLQITEALLVEDWQRAGVYIDEVLQLLRESKAPAETTRQAS